MFASYAVFGHHRPLNAVARRRGDPGREHGHDGQRPARLPGPVQHRLVVPAHPLARLRRAIGVAAAAHRRSGQHLVGLHARRCGVHRGGRDGVVRADADGRIGATGRSLGWRGGRPDQALPVASPGSCRPAARAAPSASHSGPNSQVQQHGRPSGELAVTIRRNPTDDGDLLLASGHPRQDRPHRLGPEHVDVGRHPGRRTDLRPARRRRRSGGSPQLHVHRDAERIHWVDDPVAADADQRRPGGPADHRRRGAATSPRWIATTGAARTPSPPSPRSTATTPDSSTSPRSARRTPTYPDEIKALYLAIVDGTLGPNALALEAKIRDEAASQAPIDLANQIVAELHSSTYVYQTDVRDVPCAGISTVECFATFKKGFCQYYAPTMAVILRHMGIPTRIAEGFLPGSRDLNAATEQIPFSNAHAWVEVYFPGYGWLTFDPTGGNVSQLAPLPSGNPTASGSPAADPEHRGRRGRCPRSVDEGGAGRRRRPVPGRPGLARSARGRAGAPAADRREPWRS